MIRITHLKRQKLCRLKLNSSIILTITCDIIRSIILCVNSRRSEAGSHQPLRVFSTPFCLQMFSGNALTTGRCQVEQRRS